MAVIIPRFNSAVDAAIHAEEYMLENFKIQKAEDGKFVILLFVNGMTVPHTIDQ